MLLKVYTLPRSMLYETGDGPVNCTRPIHVRHTSCPDPVLVQDGIFRVMSSLEESLLLEA